MKLFRKRAKLIPETRLAQLKEDIRIGQMLEVAGNTEFFSWLMEKANDLKDNYVLKRDAAAADGILQLTKEIERAIALKESAYKEYHEYLEEQRPTRESPAEPDDAPESRRSPQLA